MRPKEYQERIRRAENGESARKIGFEPGTRNNNFGVWRSDLPIIDIRHDKNLTKNRWSRDEFRNKKYCQGWIETDDTIPGWGKTADLIKKLN